MARINREGDTFYFMRLGRIVDLFSIIEADLQTLLWSEAGVSDVIGRAVFSGVRIDQAMSLCRRIWDATGTERPPLVERAFIQLGHLNGARNDVVHYGAEFSEKDREYIVTNARLAHTESGIRRHQMSDAVMRSIENDLRTVMAAVQARYLRGADGPYFTHAQLEALAEEPWQYTPLSPSPRRARRG